MSGKYKTDIVKYCIYPWAIRLAEYSDELDAKIDGVARALAATNAKIEELTVLFSKLDAKVAVCCDGAPLRPEVSALRDELAALRAQLDTLTPRPS